METQHLKALKEEVEELENVTDEVDDSSASDSLYNISSFGVDYTVEFLVKKIKKESFFIPPFQREYVWSKNDASKFIESILLGLPVPGIFIFKEANSPRHLVIDGQQRLKSLRFFYDGVIGERKFKLSGIKSKWLDMAYEDLNDTDRERLDDGVIHTTVFKQDFPSEGMDSVYEVFERINTGGLKLSPQEIRSCVAHGKFNDLLFELNDNEQWREIFGKKSLRLKDVELILRFFSFAFNSGEYKKPMKKFLGDYMTENRNPSDKDVEIFKDLFVRTFSLIHSSLGKKAFRPERPLNAAVFDTISATVAHRLLESEKIDEGIVKAAYDELLENEDFKDWFSRATSDDQIVESRFILAAEVFERHAS